jgi:hypothetical protein
MIDGLFAIAGALIEVVVSIVSVLIVVNLVRCKSQLFTKKE